MKPHRKLLYCATIIVAVLTVSLPAAAGSSFIWKVESRSSVVYVLGSIHMVRPEMYPLADSIEQAYQKSDVVVVEADVFGAGMENLQEQILEKGMYPPGDSLGRRLSPRTRALMSEMNIDISVYQRMRPWLAALIIQTQRVLMMGFDPGIGIDKHFYDKARADRKTVRQLESAEQQFRLFMNLTPREQEMLLYSTLLELEGADQSVDGLMQDWKTGDAEGFHETFMKTYRAHSGMQSLAEKIIFRRNERMARKIEGYLRTGRTWFVVVGAGHLTGPRGIISRLESRGYEIEQL